MDLFYFHSFKEKWRSAILVITLLAPLSLLAQKNLQATDAVYGTVKNEKHRPWRVYL